MRAVAGSRELAAVAGVNTKRIRLYVWVISSGLAGLAGVLLGLVEQTITPTLGFDVLYLLFAAVILGGVGSIYGTLAGSIILGLCMQLSTWSALFGGLPSVYEPVVGYVILLALLFLRPQGLFGRARLI
jgi:branched-chain amino acid transport system permease protein